MRVLGVVFITLGVILFLSAMAWNTYWYLKEKDEDVTAGIRFSWHISQSNVRKYAIGFLSLALSGMGLILTGLLVLR